jgi:RimJ/RimL family protein N-acetyltransferase
MNEAEHPERYDLRLRPFQRRHLPLAEPWFTDPETRRWLGGPQWPRQMLDLAGRPLGEFRGAMETGRYRWLAWERDSPVGYVDCGTTDRWTTWEGGPGGRGIISAIPVPSGSISYLADPARRGRGYGTAIITAVTATPELAHIALFTAGVEPANAASVGCLLKAGFRPLDPEPDWEGILYYARFRTPGDTPGNPA